MSLVRLRSASNMMLLGKLCRDVDVKNHLYWYFVSLTIFGEYNANIYDSINAKSS